MPLHDHFHGRLDDLYELDGFHSAWANNIVRRLNAQILPARYRSVPHVRLALARHEVFPGGPGGLSGVLGEGK